MQANHPAVIVGAGPAGCSAAIQCTRLGIPPILLDRTGTCGGLVVNAFRIENYPGSEPVSGAQFAKRLQVQLTEFGVTVETGTVTGICPKDRRLLVEGDFGSVPTLSVVIGVGTQPNKLDIPGAEELETTKLFYEVSDFMATCNRPDRTVVIGGGEAAFDYSLSLAAVGAKVTIVVRNERTKACKRLEQKVTENSAIRVITGAKPKGVWKDGTDAKVEIETSKSSVVLSCDGILCAIGRASAAPALMPGLIIGDSASVGTRHPGVFLTGDGRLGGLGQIGIAVGDGLLAAQMARAYLTSLGNWA